MSVKISNIKPHIDDEELEKLYIWVDEIELSRPKKNMARDFSDGGKHIIHILLLKYPFSVHNNVHCLVV